MKVHWTDNAIAHLSIIYEYIAHDSPLYAKKLIDKIIARSEQIADFPLSGRKVPEYEKDDIREMIEKSYRIIYRIKSNKIDVLAVVHCAQILTEVI